MVTRKHLGTGYLIGVGIGLFSILTSGILLPAGSDGETIGSKFMTILSGLIIIVGFTLSGIVLANSDLTEDRIWRIAQWATVGLGIPTFLIVFLVFSHEQVLEGFGWHSIATINIAGGGIIGILFGMIIELRSEYDRTTALNQRNTVFLRLFRHDIRNSVTVIQGHVEHIAPDDPSSNQSAEIIHNQVDHIARLSEAARQLDDLESLDGETPVDLSTLVHDRLNGIRKIHPSVKFETDIPSETYVRADDLLSSVIDNLLRNAIEHNNGQPSVWITVRPAETTSQSVKLHIQDNGPGFPEDELTVHSEATETDLRHSRGIGLWLTQWIIDSYDGEFSVENTFQGGAKVTVELPVAHSEFSSNHP